MCVCVCKCACVCARVCVFVYVCARAHMRVCTLCVNCTKPCLPLIFQRVVCGLAHNTLTHSHTHTRLQPALDHTQHTHSDYGARRRVAVHLTICTLHSIAHNVLIQRTQYNIIQRTQYNIIPDNATYDCNLRLTTHSAHTQIKCTNSNTAHALKHSARTQI